MQNSSLGYVDLKNCEQYKNPTEPFILVLDIDDNLFANLIKCAELMNLQSASLSGLGALRETSVAYYHLPTKEYETKLFKEDVELISLNGNITTVDDKPFVHIHASLGQRDHSVVGGHIMDATIAVTAEITVIPLHAKIYRKYHERTGLKLMCGMK